MEGANFRAFHGFSEIAREVDKKRRCNCDGGEIHGHCLTEGCNKRIPMGQSECEACKEREKLRRSCIACGEDFHLPEPGVLCPPFMQSGFCSDRCFERNLAGKLRRSGVPKRYLNCTLQSFDAYVPSLQRKLMALKRWVGGDLTKGLYLFGSIGAGKTHLAVGVMKELFRRGIGGLYMDGLTFVLRCQTVFARDESVEEMVNDLLRGRFLVLDDLGSEKLTDYVRQSLFHLVNGAYTREKVLVVTSNLGLERLDESNPRLASRLAQMCESIQFDEEDYRIVLAEHPVEPAEELEEAGSARARSPPPKAASLQHHFRPAAYVPTYDCDALNTHSVPAATATIAGVLSLGCQVNYS